MNTDNAFGDSGTRVGLLTFSSDAVRQFDLNQFNNKNQLMEALSVSYLGGTTNTASALQ